jgi:hypothetical protein
MFPPTDWCSIGPVALLDRADRGLTRPLDSLRRRENWVGGAQMLRALGRMLARCAQQPIEKASNQAADNRDRAIGAEPTVDPVHG